MKVCIWKNTNKSGIGDKLQDILLVLAYSRYHNCDKLLMSWKTIKQHNNIRPKFRDNDQKFNVINKYIKFPNDLVINDSFSNYKSKIEFKDYLGGIYSKKTFLIKYKLDAEKYYEIYDNIIDDFIFISNEHFNTIDTIDKVDKFIAVHLRRCDKVRDNEKNANAALGVTNTMLKKLNVSTEAVIDKYIENGYNNIAFISDSEEERDKYISLYKDKCDILDVKGDLESGEQTYIDLYILIKADTIIMSQRWSNFSVIASILGKNKLIYFDDQFIKQYKYDSKNYISYQKI